MTEPPGQSASTCVSRVMQASRKRIYEAFLDPTAVAAWLPPHGMTGEVHTFDAREGGAFRMSLTYENSEHSPDGKTAAGRDTTQGRFVELIPCGTIVWRMAFESADPAFAGEMTITWTLAPAGDATEVRVLCEGIPAGIRPEDNEAGSRSSLDNLAAFVERNAS